ncbi:MAG TPA: ABC transporter ATP-binding protein [Roseiarcus sp.]|jgi:branched-chain amino acid transport system ATP-binding protein
MSVTDLAVAYGKVAAVQGVSFDLHKGEALAILGANGAGKSSVMRALMGMAPVAGGVIRFRGQDINALPTDRRVALGLAYSPEGRRVFGDLSVHENLLMGGYLLRDRRTLARNLDDAYALFPRLSERRNQLSATLSGGEQQMLAIARALVRGPELLLLDEPSLGLAPVMVKVIYQTIRRIRNLGMTILIAEQSAHVALKVADRALVLETGRLAFQGDANALALEAGVKEAYFGAAH